MCKTCVCVCVCLFVRQSDAMVTTILPKSCGLNNFHIIQAIKVKFSIYDDLAL